MKTNAGNYSHIVWDFNGTLLDDVSICIEAMNGLLKRYGRPAIDSFETYRRNFCFPVADYYEKIGLERQKFAIYAAEWVAEYNLRLAFAGVCAGAHDVLELFRKSGCRQYLLSATEQTMLKEQVRALGLGAYFDGLIGQDDTYARGKLEAAVNWSTKVKPARALFIGDTVHDFEVASAVGAECMLLASGHQDSERLAACGCPVFDGLPALKQYFCMEECP